MKQSLYQEIEIPEGVEVSIQGNLVSVKGPEGENKKEFNFGKLKIEKINNKLKIGYDKSTKREKKLMNTLTAHIKNMIKGVKEKFEYHLKICYNHFPITVKAEGKNIEITNFLGEKIPRKTIIPEGAEVDIQKENIIIKSTNIEAAGQAAANLEAATKIRNKDRRIFQDGIFIISKPRGEI
ncbi:MAG: 50S ribosomal protein L6 [Nanoarchaeota archaeon]